ncbi:MAG: alkaline phosphatase [Alphaproteobacteria bacterium]|nr:alkaline phosphatase [Alphaproteobacteria bacterium]
MTRSIRNPLEVHALCLSLASTLALSGAAAAADAPARVDDDPWFEDAQAALAARLAVKPITGPAKNAIIFLADGMGPTTVTAARIFDGQSRGESGEENVLAFERLPHLALAKTYNTNAQTPDSAGTMSAIVTGVKTKIGVISMTDAVAPGNCAASKGADAATLVELAEQAGLATGVISTARLTHATPAAVYAHAPDRNWERDTNLPAEAQANGCRDIARQLIEFPYGDGLEVAMGGGRSHFLPVERADPEYPDTTGGRRDGRDLAAEWTAKSADHVVVHDRAGFDGLSDKARVLGLFEPSHMQYEADRAGDRGGEPSLAEMTAKAIDIMSRQKAGYVLIVEGGRVDHAHHAGNAARALGDAKAFAEAVAVAIDKTSRKDTLIVATADHGHTLTIAGYPKRGNPILGLVEAPGGAAAEGEPVGADAKRYTTLGYANGPGSVLFGAAADGGRREPTGDEAADLSYRQQAAIPMGSETHGGQDVAIYAGGPSAYLFDGTVEQNYIFHVVDHALRLRARRPNSR